MSSWCTDSQISSTCPPACWVTCSRCPLQGLVLEYFVSPQTVLSNMPTSCLPPALPLSLMYFLSHSCTSCHPPALPISLLDFLSPFCTSSLTHVLPVCLLDLRSPSCTSLFLATSSLPNALPVFLFYILSYSCISRTPPRLLVEDPYQILLPTIPPVTTLMLDPRIAAHYFLP